MRLYHGTDRADAVEAWLSHTLQPSMTGADVSLLDGCEDHPFADDEQLTSLTQFRTTAERYAAVALIEIEVDDDAVYQISSDEYLMPLGAAYDVVDVEFMDGSTFTMTRLPDGSH